MPTPHEKIGLFQYFPHTPVSLDICERIYDLATSPRAVSAPELTLANIRVLNIELLQAHIDSRKQTPQQRERTWRTMAAL